MRETGNNGDVATANQEQPKEDDTKYTLSFFKDNEIRRKSQSAAILVAIIQHGGFLGFFFFFRSGNPVSVTAVVMSCDLEKTQL